MQKEISTLIRYDRKENKIVAIFYDRVEQEYFSLTREKCEERQENARNNGYLHDQIDAALKGWPEK